MNHRPFSRRLRLRPLSWPLAMLIFLLTAGVVFALARPAFLTESSTIASNGDNYEFWFTATCAGGVECECDNLPDADTNGDGVNDSDSENSCLAVVDSDGDGIFDTVQDSDNNGIADIVDPSWTGGGGNTGLSESMPNKLDEVLDVFMTSWGFPAPDWAAGIFNGNSRDIWIFDIAPWGIAYGDGSRVELDADLVTRTSYNPRQTLAHEVWHMMQHEFDANRGAGRWSIEGQARMVPDRVWDVIDTLFGGRFQNSTATYLSNPTWVINEDLDEDGTPETNQAHGLLGASYDAALWWSYLVEQAGTQYVGTPGEGMDFLKAVLEKGLERTPLTGWAATDAVLRDRTGQGFEDTFWDFTIANVAKDYDLSSLPLSDLDGRDPMDVLRHRDELDNGNWTWYGPVMREQITAAELLNGASGTVEPMQVGVDDAGAMPAYGAKYFELQLPAVEQCPMPTWEALNSSGVPLMHSLLLVEWDDDGDSVNDVTALERHKGGSFVRGLLNRNSYSRLIAVVATGEQRTGFAWRARCRNPIVEIEVPTTDLPAAAGAPNALGRIEIFLTVKDGGGSADAVLGLDWQRDFTVSIGGVEAEILNGSYIQNQYWLLVQVPSIPGALVGSLHDLTVELTASGSSDTETNAVIFDLMPADQMLVLDRSGSMLDEDKLISAKAAANLLIQGANAGDQIGVVSFSDNATVDFGLTDVLDQDDARGVRTDAQDAVNRLAATGQTAIGAGLQRAQGQLNTAGNAEAEPWIILLSDGQETTPPFAMQVVNQHIAPTDTKVQTIALGNSADRPLMRAIAVATCGELLADHCFHSLNNDGQPVSASSSTTAYPLTNELMDIYRRIGERIVGHQRIWQQTGSSSGQLVIEVSEDSRDALLSLAWRDPNAPLTVQFDGPNSADFILLSDKSNHTLFFIPQLEAGEYTLTIDGKNEWIASLSARQSSGTAMHAYVDTAKAESKLLLPANIQVSITDSSGPVTGAAVSATVYRAEGGTSEQIILRDDGLAPHDDTPNDGLYGYSYDRINSQERHTYTFDITARGSNFTRYQRLTYHPTDTSRPDKDADGLVDQWQDRYGVQGQDEDPDRDGLTNRQEMLAGTHPLLDDTDHGGENDSSELINGRNPFSATDDELPHVSDFWCESGIETATLHFNLRGEYGAMRIFRAELQTAPVGLDEFRLLAEVKINEPSYIDVGLRNGTVYLYRLQPVHSDGKSEGRFSEVSYCQPAADPYPPASYLLINGDQYSTDETTVTLKLGQSYEDGKPEITHVKLSNTPDIQNAKWQPFIGTMPWKLEPDKAGRATVYARFRDNAGNISEEVASDSILVDEKGGGSFGPDEDSKIYLPVIVR